MPMNKIRDNTEENYDTSRAGEIHNPNARAVGSNNTRNTGVNGESRHFSV